MIDIYVGKQDDYLVLKYAEAPKTRPICRFYPLGEDETKTILESGEWLGEMGLEEPRFLILNDAQHRIFPFDIDAIDLLKQGYRKGCFSRD